MALLATVVAASVPGPKCQYGTSEATRVRSLKETFTMAEKNPNAPRSVAVLLRERTSRFSTLRKRPNCHPIRRANFCAAMAMTGERLTRLPKVFKAES